MEVDRFEHDEWEKYAAEKDITWWRGDTIQSSRRDNHVVPGAMNPLHHKGNSKGVTTSPMVKEDKLVLPCGKGVTGNGKYSGNVADKSGGKGIGGIGCNNKGSGKGEGPFNGLSLVWRMGPHLISMWVRRTGAEHTHNVEEAAKDAIENAWEVKRGEWRAFRSLEKRFAVLVNDDEQP